MSCDHQAPEFLLWFWWLTDTQGGKIRLPDGRDIDAWVGSRLTLTTGDASSALRGGNPADTEEAKRAAASGKLPTEMRIGIRTGSHEFEATLKAPGLELAGIQLPREIRGNEEEGIYDALYLYEELYSLLSWLVYAFATVRTGETWPETAGAIRAWISSPGPEVE